MRIFVRNCLLGEYLNADGGWTKELEKGKAFEKSYEAIAAASEFDVSDLEILLSFDDPVFDIHIPLKSMPHLRATGGGKPSHLEVRKRA
jgi:hypothetical protein